MYEILLFTKESFINNVLLFFVLFYLFHWALRYFLKWIKSKGYPKTKDPIIVTDESQLRAAIKNSDDYSTYYLQFMEAATWLIQNNILTMQDFVYSAGWQMSTDPNLKGIYFIYPKENPGYTTKVNLEVTTGAIYNFYNGRATLLRKGWK
jgi:hypothetical protein